MAFGDEKWDEQKGLPGKPEPGSAPKQPSEFTRVFFGMELGKAQIDNENQSNAVSGSPLKDPVPEEVNQPRRALNADAPPRDLNEGGTLSDLFGQVPLKPINPQSDTFSRLFNNQFETQPAPVPAPDFPVSGRVNRPAPSNAEQLPPEFPGARQNNVNLDDADGGSAAFGTSPQSGKEQKATKLFSPESATDQLTMGGPSAFTRVIDSSALRSATENAEGHSAAANNSPPATPALASPPAMPSWPVANMPSSPIYPPVYVPQQPVSVQMPMPAVAPVAWPQTPSFPAVNTSSLPQPQLQASQPTMEQRWIAYLPLIIGLNVLLFLTSIFILIFALTSR